MALPVKYLLKLAAAKIAADPRVRAKAAQVARTAADEAKKVAREEDRARAAGRSFSRVLRSLKETD